MVRLAFCRCLHAAGRQGAEPGKRLACSVERASEDSQTSRDMSEPRICHVAIGVSLEGIRRAADQDIEGGLRAQSGTRLDGEVDHEGLAGALHVDYEVIGGSGSTKHGIEVGDLEAAAHGEGLNGHPLNPGLPVIAKVDRVDGVHLLRRMSAREGR